MFDLFREVAQTIRTNRLRTALTGFAVAWGIFMLIVLLSLSSGLVNAFDRNMMHRNNNFMRVFGGITSMAYQGYKDGRPVTLKEEDCAELAAQDPERISAARPIVQNDSLKFAYGSDLISGGYTGVTPDYAATQGFEMLAGRFIDEADLREGRKALVISRDNAVTLFGSPREAVGKTVSGGNLAWSVVGVYSHRWERSSFVPYTTGMMLRGDDKEVSMITVDIQNIATIEEGEDVEAGLRRTLGRVHDFDAADRNAVWVHNGFTQGLQAKRGMRILTWAMWAIGILTLLSGVIGVSNIMFVSVRERTHEIGVRRAIGARPRSILIQVVAESVAITTLFGYVGIVAGTLCMAGVSAVIGDSMEFMTNPTVDLGIAVEVTVVLIAAGALAGLFPAIKATKVRPVEALRDE